MSGIAFLSLIAFLVATLAAAAAVAYRFAVPRLRNLLADIRATRTAAEQAANQSLLCYQAGRGEFDVAPGPGAPVAFPAGSWRRIAGEGKGWSDATFYKVRGLAWLDGMLYASLTGPRQDGSRGEVWCWDGKLWVRVGGDAAGGQGSWQSEPAFVDHLGVFAGVLYAAVGRDIWRRSQDTWNKVATVSDTGKAGAYCFAEHAGRLFVGCWGKPSVCAIDDLGALERLPDPDTGWGGNARTIYALASFQGALYAATGTGRLEGPSSSVFRWADDRWEQVGGQSLKGSWSQDGIAFVLGLTVFKDKLVAVVSRKPGTPAAASSVWVFDGHEWRPVAVGRTPQGMAQATILNDVIEYQGRLVVATGGSLGRFAGAFALEAGPNWRDIAGAAFKPLASSADGGYWIYRMATDGRRLFAASAGHQGAAGVFEFVPEQSRELR